MDVTPRFGGAAATASYMPTSQVRAFAGSERPTPAGPDTTHEPSTGATDAVKADGGRVLVVDDDPSILRMLRIVFMGDGYDVTTATNGVEALDAVQKDAPGVIVLDLEMPLMDGREFFRELRSRGYEMPVLILSAYGAERARGELKAEAFVSKPFEPDYLVQEVQKLLEAT